MVDSAEPRASAAGEAILVARQLDKQRADTLAWISAQDEESASWYDSTVIGSGEFWLSQEEAKRISERLSEVVAEIPRRTAAEAPADAHRVRVSHSVVPIPAPTGGEGSEPG
jgi:hypothetical protein